jgi:D-serine deaminase-like pyridoxal phosphate-dependent protein
MAAAQLAAGAVGLTVAKVGEAEALSEVGSDLLIAYPAMDPARTGRLAQLARHHTIRVAVDSIAAADALAGAARSTSSTIGILIDLDVGQHRTGLQTAAAALKLAQFVDRAAGVRLDGILCYPGHIWDPAAEQAAALQLVSDKLAEALDLWAKHGLESRIVSGGSTPTAFQSHLVPEYTEIRPGTYIFNDLNTLRGGFCSQDDLAASIVCTVISTAVPGQFVLDAGSKTLSSDRCATAPDSGHGLVCEYPDAKIVKLSEEHAQVDARDCQQAPKLGEQVTVIPNHICPCVNLQDTIWLRDGDGRLEKITVHARGKLS